MKINAVASQLKAALGTILDPIQVYVGPPQSISEPCAVIVMPDTITYSGTYVRGMDSMIWPVLVLVSRADDESLLSRVDDYVAGSGTSSIKAAFESYAYTACDTVFVATCALDIVTWNGIDYQGALFELHINGTGS